MSEYRMPEMEVRDRFFEKLWATNRYQYLEKEVRFVKSRNDTFQIDILAVNNEFQLEIFEIKVRATPKALGQIKFYQLKLKPAKCWLVSWQPICFPYDGTTGLIWFGREEIEIKKEAEKLHNEVVPKYLHLKMSKETHEQSKKVKATEEFWAYNRQILIKMGYKTYKMRKFYWRFSKLIATEVKDNEIKRLHKQLEEFRKIDETEQRREKEEITRVHSSEKETSG